MTLMQQASERIRGLYAITPDEADTGKLVNRVMAALAGGTRVLQYRNKTADPKLRQEQAEALLALCRREGVPFIVNDHLDLALAIGADGVHLGGEDGDIAAARRALGPDRLLGASCYNRYELALAAREAGADHVAFGAAFVSKTKPGAVHAPLSLYERAHRELGLPVVAIGGITANNATSLVSARADAVAVITALFDADDIRATAAQFSLAFNRPIPTPHKVQSS